MVINKAYLTPSWTGICDKDVMSGFFCIVLHHQMCGQVYALGPFLENCGEEAGVSINGHIMNSAITELPSVNHLECVEVIP